MELRESKQAFCPLERIVRSPDGRGGLSASPCHPLRRKADYSALESVVRTTLRPQHLAESLGAALRPLDPNLPLTGVQSLQDPVDKPVSPRRFLVLLMGAFAVFARLLASLGTYVVISYSVSQRVQEIGIRMALGASLRNLQGGILLRTLALAALGLALGMAASRLLSHPLGSLLFSVTSGDPVTYLGMAALLAAVAAGAGYLPARKASRMDPMIALLWN